MYNKISKIISDKYNVAVRPSMQGEWHATIEITENESHNYINTIFVPELNRGQGIAKELINLIEEETKIQNKQEVILDAFPYSDNQGNTIESIVSLVNWYKSLGYAMDNDNDYNAFVEDADTTKLYGYEEIAKGTLTMFKEV